MKPIHALPPAKLLEVAARLHPAIAGHAAAARCGAALREAGPSHASAPPAAQPFHASGHRHVRRRTCFAARATLRHGGAVCMSAGEIVEVEDLSGIRVREKEDGTPFVEYLVKWKDGSPDTWEPASNLADDLLRDYEQRWWAAVRKGDEATILARLEGGGPTLARTVEEGRRSALHYAAALGRVEVVKRLLAEGAEVDLADKDGYTPLHMAAGYLHTTTIVALLEGGADPEQKDREGRSPLELVESLRAALPAGNPATAQRRVALEDVLRVLTENIFEDVEPAAVLEVRTAVKEEEDAQKDKDAAKAAAALSEREFLVRFPDEPEPVWVLEKYVSEEVVSDFDAGLEYAEGAEVVDVRNRGDSRTYLVRWGDGYPDSWEPEEHVSLDLVAAFEAGRAVAAQQHAVGAGADRAAANGSPVAMA